MNDTTDLNSVDYAIVNSRESMTLSPIDTSYISTVCSTDSFLNIETEESLDFSKGENSLEKMISYCFNEQDLERAGAAFTDVNMNYNSPEVIGTYQENETIMNYETDEFNSEVYYTSEEDDANVFENSASICNDSSDKVQTENDDTQDTQADRGKKRKYNAKENLTRKRSRNPENWERNLLKASVNRGLEYISTTTKKIVPARSMKRTCGPGCRFKCEDKITDVRRNEIFTEFWNIADHSRQYDFLIRHVSEKSKATNQENTKRKFVKSYTFINQENKHITVCQTMFINTLGISMQMVKTIFNKINSGETVLKDKRGSSKIRPRAVAQDKTNSVIEHINKFARVESHYSRKDSNREYLDEQLSLSLMYKMYLDWAKSENKTIATKHHYSDVFNTQFNISFFKPKKDQCDTCESYRNAADFEKELLEEKYNCHNNNKEKSRQEKAADIISAKENKITTSMICFDFQKVLSTPKIEASSIYYKRKLSVYNFTVYDVIRHKAYCYVWSENDAKKGSDEVASCLLHYISRSVLDGVTDFISYSDNCGGQNRNKNLFSMFVYASNKFKINIKHTFLEAGHTQNEGDSVHARIERYSAGRKIYTLDEWCRIITSAKEAQPRYEVIQVTYDMIYTFKDLSNNQNWSKFVLKNNKQITTPVGISKFKQVLALGNKPNQIRYKTSFDGEYEVLVTRKEKKHINVEKYELKPAYGSVQGIASAKYKDLISLCKSNLIPVKYHEYFKAFPIRTTNDESEENE